MTNRPIDRESVERLVKGLRKDAQGYRWRAPYRERSADTLLALRAALDEAEAERHRWRQAAAKGSLHTQADLDRAVAEARAVALQEAYLSGWVNGSNGVEPPDFGNPLFEKAPGD